MNEIAGTGTQRGSPAPSPYANRGVLSEAWYRALYGTQTSCARAGGNSQRFENQRPAKMSLEDGGPAKRVAERQAREISILIRRERRVFSVASTYRVRGDRLITAARAVRNWRSAIARRTTCTVSLPRGQHVSLLVQQRGSRLHIVAVADDAAGAVRIGAALHRARAALLAHGVRIAIDSREKGTA